MTTYDETRLSESDRALIHALLFNAGVLVEPEPESNVWHPNNNETVWELDSNGMSDPIQFACGNVDDENSWKQGNIFPTKEAAEFEANRRRVIAELKRHAEERNFFPIDWEDYGQDKWHLAYYASRPEGCKVYPTYTNAFHGGAPVCFTSESIANAAIEKIGEDNLIKYYFCINN